MSKGDRLMKVMLLAAGLGTRLKPITDKIPKPLIPVNGIPLIFYNLALLKKHGVQDVVINLHYMGDKIKKILGDGSSFGFKFRYSVEPKILGTGGGIKRAESFLDDGSFVVMNSDIIVDINLKAFFKWHRSKRNGVSLAVVESDKAFELGVLQVEKEGRVLSILGQPMVCESGVANTFFTGVHVLSPSFIKNYKRRGKTCIVRDGYIPYLEAGGKIGAYLYQGYWNDLGTVERLKKTEQDLKNKKIVLSYFKELTWIKNQLDDVSKSL